MTTWEPEDLQPDEPVRRTLGPVIAMGVMLAVFLVSLLVWGLVAQDDHLPAARPPDNVLLITIDTLRADCLGCYGHPAVKTPNIDGLARGGTLFEQCMSSAPLTLPSHASMMTGTYPYVHRARNNGRLLADEGNVTLAEHLVARGYATAAEVGAFVLDATWGIDQGFAHYRATSDADREAAVQQFDALTDLSSDRADEVCDRALAWLANHDRDRPFFLWVHFFDPHQPWSAPPEYAAPYGNSPIAGYFAEIAFVDAQIGRLAASLRQRDLFERTLIVLTTDHGEGLGEHREGTHGYYVYESTMRAALILRYPEQIAAGQRIAQPVRTIDIAPTILDLLGQDPMTEAQGRSLVGLMAGDAGDSPPAYGESLSAYEAQHYAPLRCLRAGSWKYIHAPTPELYDLATDPNETTNLAAEQTARTQAMRMQLEMLIAESPRADAASSAAQLDASAADRLAALGYVGGYAPALNRSEDALLDIEELPDPKTRIVAYNRLVRARQDIIAGVYDRAIDALVALRADEPENPAVIQSLANALHNAGRSKEAVPYFESVLKLQPNNALIRHRLGKLLVRLQEFPAGIAHLQAAGAAMANNPRVWGDLGEALMRVGRTADAVAAFRRAAELDPAGCGQVVSLSDALAGTGEYVEAIQRLRDAQARCADDLSIANNLAWYLATAPVASARDGALAVRLAETVAAGFEHPDASVLDTLAAAYAEASRFAEALDTAERALKDAEQTGDVALAEEIRKRLSSYRANRPARLPDGGTRTN